MNRPFASPRSAKRRSARRSGMTLLEVMIALALFVAAMTVISQILRMGSDSAVRAQLQADAALRAESKLNEVVSGILPLSPIAGEAFEDNPEWTWSLAIDDESNVTLKRLTLTVTFTPTSGTPPLETRFVRLLRDPSIFQQSGSESSTLETINSVL